MATQQQQQHADQASTGPLQEQAYASKSSHKARYPKTRFDHLNSRF